MTPEETCKLFLKPAARETGIHAVKTVGVEVGTSDPVILGNEPIVDHLIIDCGAFRDRTLVTAVIEAV